jgi:hypothetical protein
VGIAHCKCWKIALEKVSEKRLPMVKNERIFLTSSFLAKKQN